MRDYKLKPGADWAAPVLDMTRPTNPALKTPGEIFHSNVVRIHSFATLLSNLLVTSMVIEQARARAKHTFNHSMGMSEQDFSDLEIRQDLVAFSADQSRMATDGIPSEEFKQLTNRAYRHVQWCADKANQTAEALDAWLASQVTGIWTAIETLASDLWISALNAHPAILAELRGKTEKGSKSVQLYRLAQFGFDVQGNMGSILASEQNFSRLATIIDAYYAAFSEDADEIIEIIRAKPIYAVSQVRHLIVHSASRFDDEYLRKTKSIDYLPKGSVGDKMALDAESVDAILRPALKQAVSLISAVDKWLTSH
ncbi:hypothetical protein [Rhizobium leguminosarum]|uniref:Uncharacterized protein n=1 Tax=Rhizobium leguminosarum TaxID=384 RepID=A0A7W9ZS81_RHILE|nr:hypothetical protein [Rhizobium leguminosarum]MBB6220554.1 hypothetical protein [Rhizobium leguminosarum]